MRLSDQVGICYRFAYQTCYWSGSSTMRLVWLEVRVGLDLFTLYGRWKLGLWNPRWLFFFPLGPWGELLICYYIPCGVIVSHQTWCGFSARTGSCALVLLECLWSDYDYDSEGLLPSLAVIDLHIWPDGVMICSFKCVCYWGWLWCSMAGRYLPSCCFVILCFLRFGLLEVRVF